MIVALLCLIVLLLVYIGFAIDRVWRTIWNKAGCQAHCNYRKDSQ